MYTLHPPSVSDKSFPSTPRIRPLAGKGPHSVGPGRLERAYQAQVARLSRELQSIQQAQVGSEKKLEMARLVERGTLRYVDRMEEQVQHREEKSRRALVLVGTLQHDNQMLQARILKLESRLQRLAAPQAVSFTQRLWSRLGIGRQHLDAARQSS
ncbi:MAG: hypothetical protein JKY61_10220 [Planctomycetes bacterium]|nr:hypothetical protein [Planctomycetota bacterium]